MRVPWWPHKPRVEELGTIEGRSSPGEPPNWEHCEDARGKSHLFCCPSPLQLLRALLGLLRSLWGTRKLREEELGTAQGRNRAGQRWDGTGGESAESLLGKLEELSIKGCLELCTSDRELPPGAGGQPGDSQEAADTPGWSRDKALRM